MCEPMQHSTTACTDIDLFFDHFNLWTCCPRFLTLAYLKRRLLGQVISEPAWVMDTLWPYFLNYPQSTSAYLSFLEDVFIVVFFASRIQTLFRMQICLSTFSLLFGHFTSLNNGKYFGKKKSAICKFKHNILSWYWNFKVQSYQKFD